MTPNEKAISEAFKTWAGCRPHQCVRDCPKLAPKERPSDDMCARLVKHLAAAVADLDAEKTWVETFIEPTEARNADANG